MTSVAQHLYLQALELADDERAELAGRLIESLDEPTEDGVESAWSEEIQRRIAALDAGTVEPVPWEKVEAMIFGDQDALRRSA